MVKEQLVRATVHAAVSIAKDQTAPETVLPQRVAWLVNAFLPSHSQRLVLAREGYAPQRLPVGLDEPWEEGRHVPWYAN